MKYFRYFTGSLIVSLVGLALAGMIGFYRQGTTASVLQAVFIASVLSVLEVSLSFDNAVVNASVLRRMTPVWRHRFLTWGIAIAVFGMRLVLPLLIVSVVASIGPYDAIYLAVADPEKYGRTLETAKPVISAFGGAFLAMVCLKYFLDAEKDIHWIHVLEEKLTVLGRIEAIQAAIILLVLWGVSTTLPASQLPAFLVAGNLGLVAFIFVDGIAAMMEVSQEKIKDMGRASAGLFLYLEVLDASFSFDGVIGAFALTTNLFIIAIGLGIGAMFVRSLTIMLVEEGTLDNYRYLEHGAFYAIGALALIMFLKVTHEVPELVTGMIGALFIGLSILSSVRYNKKIPAA